MNILPCIVADGAARFGDHVIPLEGPIRGAATGKTEIGVRPEYVTLGDTGLPATVTKVSDVGRHIVVDCDAAGAGLVPADPALGPVSCRAWPPVHVHRADPDYRGAIGHCHRPVDAAQRYLGAGLSGADGAAHADPMERGSGCGLGDHCHHGRVALDLAGGAFVLRRVGVDPGCLLPGGQNRRRVELVSVSVYPAAQDEKRADHCHPVAVHGQFQHLHRTLCPDRWRAGQFDHAVVDRPGENRAGTV
ncbi:hypothetical protein GQR58_030156 [Nymphon striatum]|nr:hypothetical protein GQR58_030156 [Nymphon striatum]